MALTLTPPRRGHLRLLPPCAPLPAVPDVLVELASHEVLVGVLVGRPYVRAVSIADIGDAPTVPPLRAAMNLLLLGEGRVVVIDGDERWFRDVMALHRAGGVERWVVAIDCRSGDAPTALRARRERETTAAEQDQLAQQRLHDLDALLGPAALHGRPRLHSVPPTPGR